MARARSKSGTASKSGSTTSKLRNQAKLRIAASSRLRSQLRQRIQNRIDELDMTRTHAADVMHLSIAQTSRLCNDHDAFSLDRLVDAAEGIGLNVDLRAVRPYSRDLKTLRVSRLDRAGRSAGARV